MKKAIKKLTALAMVATMAVGALSGCSKDGGKNGKISDKPTKVETSWGMESWEKFDETVKITVPVYDRSKEGYPAVDDNYWTQWVQKEFGDKWNIEVEYVAIPRSDVMNTYNLLISSDDTPTIMMEYDYPKVAQWATEGAMQTIDLTKFAKVAPTYYQKMIDNKQLGYTDIGDGTYFVLSEYFGHNSAIHLAKKELSSYFPPFSPPVPTKSVSQKEHSAVKRSDSRPDQRLHPEKRQKTAGRPLWAPSPCNE